MLLKSRQGHFQSELPLQDVDCSNSLGSSFKRQGLVPWLGASVSDYIYNYTLISCETNMIQHCCKCHFSKAGYQRQQADEPSFEVSLCGAPQDWSSVRTNRPRQCKRL